MKKLFVSVPMRNRQPEEIIESIEKMKKIAEIYVGEELELIDSYAEEKPPINACERIWYLSESIKKLAEADYMIGLMDVYEHPGCIMENDVARKYGIPVILADNNYIIPNYCEYVKSLREERWPQC